VLYHNRFADTAGWIKISAAYLDKNTGDLKQKSLAEAMGLPFEGCVIFKDYVTHLEYIRSNEELWQKGMFVELHAYQHHVFMDWRFVDDEKWRDIYVALNGAGVESMQAKWEEMFGEEKEKEKSETEEESIETEEEVKVKKPRKKAAAKKKAADGLEPATEVTKKAPAKRKAPTKKSAKKDVSK
jgi:hypothetical protein